MAKPDGLGYRRVQMTELEPNPWNPNKMPGVLFAKLVKNLEETLKKNKRIPPVVVRPHPTDKKRLQIIDGFHRFKAYKQLHQTEIDVFVMDVDDEAAKLLTANLNYLRGDKDPVKYVSMLADLMEHGTTLDRLSEMLPEDEADIEDLITTYGDGAAIRGLIDSQSETATREAADALSDDNLFVELRFNVSASQAKVIQREIDRIGKVLHGHNVEGRALEFMAAQSATTELPHELVPKEEEKPEGERKIDKARAAAKEKLRKMKEAS